MKSSEEKERHPFRTLFKLALFTGIISFVVKTVAAKKHEFVGLTESEARRKFEEKLGPRLGEDRANDVADRIIPKLKDRGVIVEDPIAEAVDDIVEDLTDEATESGDD